MDITVVESTTFATVGYDEFRKMLRLEFCSHEIYLYAGVPATVHQELLSALSKAPSSPTSSP
jgi:hypothetical protein